VDHVWAGHRESEPAGICGAPDFRSLPFSGSQQLHHALDAVAAQAAVMADALDLQQAPVDFPTDLLQVGQIA